MKFTIASFELKVSELEKKNTALINAPSSHKPTPTTSTSYSNKEPSTAPNNYMQEVLNTYINEEKEKAKRRLNVMIHNVPESPVELMVSLRQVTSLNL